VKNDSGSPFPCLVKTNGTFSSLPVFPSQITLFGRACHYTIIGMVSRETDDILSFYERRKTEEKDKKTSLS
jgi:hypothetical protein